MKASFKEINDWICQLEITEGPLAGDKFKMLPFQRRFLRKCLESPHSALSMARKNGKSTLCAAIAACAFVGPLAIPRGQILCVAASLRQAEIVFKHAKFFLKEWLKDEKRFRVRDNSQIHIMEDNETGSAFQAIGMDPDTAHGLAPSLVIADEPAKWPQNDGPKMRSALITAAGAHEYSRFIAIGTRPDDKYHWFAQMLKGGTGIYAQVHAADDDDDEFSMKSIRAANPAWDHLKSLQAAVKLERDQAKDGGSYLASYRSLRLNMGTSDVQETESVLTVAEWAIAETRQDHMPPREGPVCIGYDLGEARSMSAFAIYWPETGRCEVFGAFGDDPDLAARGRSDFVGDRYVDMERRGELRTYPGITVPISEFLLDMHDEFVGNAEVISATADNWRQGEAEGALKRAAIGWPIEWRRVGAGPEGAEDLRNFQKEVVEGHMKIRRTVMMASAIRESKLSFINGNPRIEKARQKGRIDALQAVIHAVGAGRRYRFPRLEEKPVQLGPEDFILHEVSSGLQKQA